MKWNYGFLSKKAFLTLSLVLSVLLSFQISQSQNSVVQPSCIVFDNCPSNQTLCADTVQNGVLGSNVFWSLPNVSHNCYGVDTESSFQMLFELNEQLLSQQCWEFNYISRVGTDGGSVKLFNGNDNDGDGKSKIITPFLILEDDTNVSIELNYVNGNYAVELFLVPIDNSGDLSLGSQTVNGNQSIYNWAANFDPGNGPDTGISGIYRLKFVFTFTGQRPSNANSGDTIIAVKGFLIPSDNCSAGVDFTVSGPNTGFYPVGSHDLEYVAVYTSPTGEVFTQSCLFNITVVDVVLDIAVVDPNCTETGSITAVAGDQGLSQFGTAPYSYTLTPSNISNETGFFDNLGGGDYYVTVTDANNCTKTSDLISLVVVNTNPPTITAPDDITIEGCTTDDIENTSALPFSTLESAISETQFLAEGGEFTTSNNSTFTYTDVASGSCPIVVTRTYTITDDCDNSETTKQIFTIEDTTAPTFVETLPADVTVECDAIPTAEILTASDNCNTDIVVDYSEKITEGDCSYNYVLYRTWIITDDCKNQTVHTQTITVQDTTAPTFVEALPADATVECDAIPTAVTLKATDNCGTATVTFDEVNTPGACAGEYTLVRTWTATDECGNETVHTQTITVVDTTAPTFVEALPADVTVECDAIPSAETLTATDNCGTATVTFNEVNTPGTCAGEYTLVRTWTATDECGNETVHTQTITVQDTTAPTFVEALPADATVECDAIPTAETLTATDNCGDATVTFNEVNTPGTCAGEYTLVRTWTATDECGNETVHSQTITVQDTTAPTFVEALPADATVECDVIPTAETLTATDNCGDATVTFNEVNTPDACAGEYTLVRTWTATDECGNETVHTQTITVVDTTAPTFVEALPADATVECDAIPTAETLTATDNCGDATVTFNEVNTPGACAGEYTLVRTWTATDECGNETVHTQTITVVDTTAPTFVEALPADATVECDAIPTAETLTATDNCGTATVTFNEVNTPGACAGEYTLVRTWTATDECGNETVHTQTITVQDTTAPTFVEALPADATVECDVIPTAETLTATDNCGTATVTFDENITAGACAGESVIVRTWTATDECGNETVHTQTITVADNNAPVLTVPADITIECTNDTTPANTGNATATDNCGDVTITFSDAITDTCGNTQIITRTWTATDDCGNTTSSNQIITTEDTTNPIISNPAQDIVIECDGSGNNDSIQNWLDTNGGAIATDSCGDITWTNNYNGADSDCALPVVVTFTATDECGNIATTTATYAIQDTTAPVIDTPASNLTVECDTVDNINDLQNWLNTNGGALATDDCSSVTWSNNFGSLNQTCGLTGNVTVIFTATDSCGNSSSTEATFTVVDTTEPTFVEALPADATVECDAIPTAETLTATDNCGTATVTFDEVNTPGACAGDYTLVRTWTATDECGNETVHTQTITVQDTTAPTFVEALPADATVECDAIPTAETLTATDNCGDATVTFNEVNTPGACTGEYTLVRTWTATDECGNETVHSQTITVQDTTAPTFVEALPADATVECDVIPTAETLTATDNCGDATVTFNEVNTPGACTGEYTLVRTWTATDECGNETVHSQTITVQDTTAPTFVEALPADATVECDVIPTAETLTATDNCGTATVTFNEVNTPGTCAGEYTLVRTWTATDECGNETVHTQTITVQDTTAPTFVEALPADATVECDVILTAETLTAIDNCGDATVTFNEVNTPGACAGEYTLVRTWTATDGCGNETVHTQTITVQDTTAPTFVEALPADATVECDVILTAETLTAIDNCGDATVTFNEVNTPGACAGEYTLVRTWTATDGCGNETVHTQNISVIDTTAPTFVEALPADATVECDAIPSAETLTATDNCGDATVTFDENITAGACAGESVIVRTWTATDECGNETVHSQTITVQDTTAPTFVEALPADATVECDAIPTTETLTATDNCGDATVTFDENITAGACAGESVIVRTWTATDECGNETVHSQTITVQDTTAPTFVEALPADATVECDVIPTAETLTATDNCGDATVTFNEVNTPGACAGEYTLVRTWTATDECGNETVHTQTITVQDTTAPTFVEALPADATVECDVIPTAETLTATDNCGTATVTFDENITAGACAGESVIVRTWTATDECGNETVHSQTITVQDTTAPTFVEALPADATVECDAIPTTETLTATDNCGDATVTFNEVNTPGACAGEYTLVRTWTATDECGNETVHTQTINVRDITAPSLTNSLETNIFAICNDIPEVPQLVFEDACSNDISVVFIENSTQTDIPENYQIIREWTVTDDCGNEAIFTQTINVSVKVDVSAIQASICIEDIEVDLFDYLPNDITQGGTWTVVTGNANLDGSIFDPSTVELGDYTFRYNSNDDVCFTQVLLNLNVNDDCVVLSCGEDNVEISKAVTPNNDLINDFFTVTGIEDCGFVVEVEIFNRWGAKIFESKNYQNNWGGETSKSSVGNAGKVPTGTYYYIVKLRNSGLSPFTGPIYVATK